MTWDSGKQKSIALSPNEAEYMGFSEAAKEAIYSKRFFIDLGLKINGSILIYNTNLRAVQLAKNPVHHARSKHIRYYFVHQELKDGIISVKHIST